MSKRPASDISEEASNLSNAAAKLSRENESDPNLTLQTSAADFACSLKKYGDVTFGQSGKERTCNMVVNFNKSRFVQICDPTSDDHDPQMCDYDAIAAELLKPNEIWQSRDLLWAVMNLLAEYHGYSTCLTKEYINCNRRGTDQTTREFSEGPLKGGCNFHVILTALQTERSLPRGAKKYRYKKLWDKPVKIRSCCTTHGGSCRPSEQNRVVASQRARKYHETDEEAPPVKTNEVLELNEDPTGPVVIISDCDTEKRREAQQSTKILRPESANLLDDMLYPLSRADFLNLHFRNNAVCIQRRPRPSLVKKFHRESKDFGSKQMVSYICQQYLFDLDARQIFAETSSENVFLWLRPPPGAASSNTLNSVEISDPDTAFALHQSGLHPAYCRAPPQLEQLLVGSLLRATGLGGGHYHPPHSDTVTLGGGTTLGRGEVELFIGAKNPGEKSKSPEKPTNGNDKTNNKHTTGAHTDFQENFTIQLSGVKRWTLRRGRVRHPLRATTPHYCREASVIENQLKIARLSCMAGDAAKDVTGNYGFEYNDNNAYGPEQVVTLYPGDVLYFPSGMWHTVKTIKPGVSLNVSLMGTTYANLVCDALQHLLVGTDERWREVVTSRPDADGANRLQELMAGLSETVHNFVTRGGGAQSVLPPVLCHPPLEFNGADDASMSENGGVTGEENGLVDKEDGSDSGNVVEEESEVKEEEDPRSAGLIIHMDQFVGPVGWSCEKPLGARLIKNPLASLIAMNEIALHVPSSENENTESIAKQYILNVNYAGNEMFESHIRCVLVTSEYSDLMDEYVDHPIVSADDITPPDCLFYYGLFSWAV